MTDIKQAENIQQMFTDLKKQFNSFKPLLVESGRSHVFVEISKKLSEMDWIIGQIQVLNKAAIRCIQFNGPDYGVIMILEVHTETFYHFAWRVIEIVEHNKDLFFGLSLKNTGVRRVRNVLIQHPERQPASSQQLYPSFTVGGAGGPKIKAFNSPKGSYVDQGVFKNATEFVEKFTQIIEVKKPL